MGRLTKDTNINTTHELLRMLFNSMRFFYARPPIIRRLTDALFPLDKDIAACIL